MRTWESILRRGAQLMVVCLLAGLSQGVWALEVNNKSTFTHSFDRGAPPGTVPLWNNESYGINSPSDSNGSNPNCCNVPLGCNSITDASTGACPLAREYTSATNDNISLLFTEQRSGDRITLTIHATFGDMCRSGKLLNHLWRCGYRPNGSWLLGHIEEQDLARIPHGGVWTAQLKLNGSIFSNTLNWVTDITLNVTDNGHADIFFPAFNTSTPVVNLNLNTRPLSPGSLPADRKTVSGGAHVDLCLYDGYNLNSPWLDVTVSDPRTVAGRAPEVFSVADSSGKLDDDHRLDYNVMLSYSGQSHQMTNGQPFRLASTDKGPVRPVTLVNVPGTVLCAPAALDLSVLPFASLSKAAGHYSGTLSVILSANTQTP